MIQNDLQDVSRIVIFTAENSGRRNSATDLEFRNYFDLLQRKLAASGLSFITANSFAEFDTMLTTGNFYVGIINFPEDLPHKDWVRLHELVPAMGGTVKGFVLATHRDRSDFPLEVESYGKVIRAFNPVEREAANVFDYVVEGMDAFDRRPDTNFIPPWETEPIAFTKYFDDFPLEVRTACEQYLLYFRDFLSDIGIRATTNIAHEAGRVLFSIVPENADEALDAIRDALEVFLRLPTISSDIAMSSDDDISSQHLQDEVIRLQKKVAAMEAMQQAQLARLKAEQLSAAAIPETATDIMLAAAHPDLDKSQGIEERIDGMVKFGAADVLQIGKETRIPEILPWLRNLVKQHRERRQTEKRAIGMQITSGPENIHMPLSRMHFADVSDATP